jgi:SAM-dependent methyltransferase
MQHAGQSVCPACGAGYAATLFDKAIACFDDARFNLRIRVVCCDRCGFVYNDAHATGAAIEEFYQNETLYSGETGFGVGGTTPADVNRYTTYLDFLAPAGLSNEAIVVDVGCAKGGLLWFLKQRGFSRLQGVEIDPRCVEYARSRFGLDVHEGSVANLPFGDNEVDLLIYNHVLEHLDDPLSALREAGRVLKHGGLLFVEVPDASRYAAGRIFDFFWLCMREHLNHFDPAHLEILAALAGFDHVAGRQAFLPNSPQYVYPSLLGLFRKRAGGPTNDGRDAFALRNAIQDYVRRESASVEEHRRQLAACAAGGRPVYVWGIGIEFFSLYSLAGLRECNLRYLVDKNPAKQTKTVGGLRILPPECFGDAPADAAVVLTSTFHKEEMRKYLESVGFRGDILSFD